MRAETLRMLKEEARAKQVDFDKSRWNCQWYAFGRGAYKDARYEKSIKLYRMPNVSDKVVSQVKSGIEQLIGELGLKYEVDCREPNMQVYGTIRNCIEDGVVNTKELSDRLSDDFEMKVIILDNYLDTGRENWGKSEFRKGYIFISVPEERQNDYDFIRQIAKHEAGHLFGYHKHHSDTNVAGYQDSVHCNMNWTAETMKTCPKCLDAMKSFWNGINEDAM